MRFYIATGLERGAEAKALSEQLAAMGHSMTYAWWEHGSVQADGPERIREVAVAEFAGVEQAELFIALLPGARGTHTEFGGAIQHKLLARSNSRPPNWTMDWADKLIVLVGPTEDANGRTCAFYLHPAVDERFVTIGELLAWLRGRKRAA